ncbi:addiction module toxin RelE [Yersinia enterocolitica]|nr:addiction module toxin RelE [Yersinia enterocolitica]EKN5986537.1 addiction module toxin RelE [Yersinia enterocolitica]
MIVCLMPLFCNARKIVFYRKVDLLDFEIQEGGKGDNPDELTQVSDSGERKQPTHLRLEK